MPNRTRQRHVKQTQIQTKISAFISTVREDLDVDILKIDKSFVDALEYKNVTPHIIEMAKTLKLKMVAEGIETSKQEEWLRQHGVHYGQGWLYSKALPKEDFLRWAEQHL